MTEASPKIGRPVPQPDEASLPFFEGAKQGVLRIQRCTRCAASLAPGSIVCSQCLSPALEWVDASGRGILFSFAIMHQLYHPGFAREIPYNVAVVELEEGPRLNTNIVGISNQELRIGMPLEVTFEAMGDEVVLPKFRPAKGRAKPP